MTGRTAKASSCHAHTSTQAPACSPLRIPAHHCDSQGFHFPQKLSYTLKHFLELVADDLLQRIGSDLSHTAVIFPNKRASLFFNEHLLPADSRPVWSPRYLTISELFLSLTDKRVADPIDTVCRLYQHYTRLTGSDESLDFFYGWGERLLADFDDIDKNRADAAKVFRDLRDYGELESHDFLTEEQIAQLNRFVRDFSKEKLTHLRTNFTRLWDHLLELYQALRNDLAQSGEAYEGQLFREVAEALEHHTLAVPDELQHVAFVGFNVIDRVEHTLFSVLKEEGKALFYWDYDTYYAHQNCATTLHEAGLFMQANLRDFPNALDEASGCFDNLMKQRDTRTLRYVGAPTELAQAQHVAQWLEDPSHFNPTKAQRTAVVLCNELLLQPVLHALPPQVSEVNITKGFQLSHTQAYACLQRQMRQIEAELDAEAVSQRDTAKGNTRFALPTGEACLPYLQRLLQQTADEARRQGEADEGTDPQMRVLDTEAFFQTYTTLNRMARLVEGGRLPVQLDTLFKLINQVLRTTTIPFHGEPAVGLQVMGVLETRCLDFDNLIMLSVGEGVLPAKGNDGSFIPYLIRKQHRLTTPDRQVAVYAYYFHRLLQRANHVELLYNTSTEGLNRGEMSRFMRALLVETEGRLPIQHAVLESTPRCVSLSPVVQAVAATATSIHDDTSPAAAGKSPLLTRISPSALKTYFKCPLQFYYHYIERLEAPQTNDPIINANDFGSVFHRAAERLFTEQLDAHTRPVTPEAINRFLQQGGTRQIVQLTNECFDELQIPAHHITAHAVVSYLTQLLKCEAGGGRHGKLPAQWFKVIEAEQEHSITLPVKFGNGTVPITLYGDIDRRDEAMLPDGTHCMRIIDYKTGRKHDAPSYEFDDFFTHSRSYPENPMQAMLYALTCTPDSQLPIVPMLYYIPSMSAPGYTAHICIDHQPVMHFQQMAGQFREKLCDTLAEIIDPDTPFEPTHFDNYCTYCAYQLLCGHTSRT